jgi:hypothetical protein
MGGQQRLCKSHALPRFKRNDDESGGKPGHGARTGRNSTTNRAPSHYRRGARKTGDRDMGEQLELGIIDAGTSTAPVVGTTGAGSSPPPIVDITAHRIAPAPRRRENPERARCDVL